MMPVAGGITTTTTQPRSQPFEPDQWPAFVGYGAFFAACCALGVAVAYGIDRMARRR